MNLLWPGFLFLLGLIPLVIVIYIWLLRRRRRFAVRYSSLSLVQEAMPHRSWLRRHLPFILFMIALASLVIALGRPMASVAVPSGRATIILSIDVSRSMCSRDIPPNRLRAAKDAALSFVQRQAAGTQIGVVAFAGFAELIQPPTNNLILLENAIENLAPARRTAIGSAILRSLDAIAEVDDRVAPSERSTLPGSVRPPASEEGYVPHIIVLLTDGASNSGPPPLSAAQQAAARGVRIYPIGFGTSSNNLIMDCGDRLGDDLFGGPNFGFQFGGGGFRREIDEVTLKQIAEMTGGTYYSATSAGELQSVFQNLPTYLIMTNETIEISVFFVAIGALLAIAALVLSLLWHPLP